MFSRKLPPSYSTSDQAPTPKMRTKGNNDVLAHIIHYRPLIMTDDNINVVQGSPHSLPSDDVDFPDIFLPTASEAPSTLQKDFVPREKTNTASQSDETMNTELSNSVGNETTMTGGPVSAQQEQEVRPLPLSLQTSIKRHSRAPPKTFKSLSNRLDDDGTHRHKGVKSFLPT